MTGLMELLTNKEWMISPDYVRGVLPVIKHNLTNHIALGDFNKQQPYVIKDAGGSLKPVEYQVTRDGGRYSAQLLDGMNEPFVNVMPVAGPITRNGDACSYGSIDLRNWLMQAASNGYCRGHIFYINTPGGSAWAKNDFQQGIDFAHSQGQKVIAFVDGDCFSAGMYLASLCDEVFVMNPNDELGCIGVLASFYTLADGAKNQFTDETFHEIYDPESFDKNKWYRDVAENHDTTEIVKTLTEMGQEFRADIKKSFPNATEEHIHGKTFRASEVMGVFVDGVMSLGGAVQRLFDISSGKVQLVNRATGEIIHNQNNKNEMNIFQKIRESISQVEAEAQTEGNQNEEITALNNRIAELEQENNSLHEQVDTLTAEREHVILDRDSLNEQVNTLTAERDAKVEEVNTLTAERDNLQNELNAANESIAAKDEEINNLKAQVGSHYEVGNRLNGKSAQEGKENKQTREEQLQECREKMGWTKK